MIDHVVYATDDLVAAAQRFADLFGFRPEAGGSHPTRGTRNLLVGLGGSSYLEIIGPDEAQPPPSEPRPFDIDAIMTGARAEGVVAWCARPAVEIDVTRDALVAAGAQMTPTATMSRATPDGDLLEWRLTMPTVDGLDAGYPFLIDWGDTQHPSSRIGVVVEMNALTIPTPPGWSMIQPLVGDDRLRPADGAGFVLTVAVDGRDVTVS